MKIKRGNCNFISNTIRNNIKFKKAEINMTEKIKIESIISIIAQDVWYEKKRCFEKSSTPGIPSFSELSEIADEMKKKSKFSNHIITFDSYGSTLEETPFYNYLLFKFEHIYDDYPFAEDENNDKETAWYSAVSNINWQIIGFSSFNELNSYILCSDFLCNFKIFVKCADKYEKTHIRLAFKPPHKRKIYTDEWGFYRTYADLKDHWHRETDYKYYFEIPGLYEIHSSNGIFCGLAGSHDELCTVLEARTEQIFETAACPYSEKGKIFFEKSTYFYIISVGKQHASYNLSDKNKNNYCTLMHEFINCDKCSYQNECTEKINY